MNYEYSKISYPSRDGKSNICAHVYYPKDKAPKAVIQLAHGMIDHVGRYEGLADLFCSQGYVFAGNDHLGHGDSVASAEDFGYFAKKDGYELVIKDLHSFNSYLSETYGNLPIILMGHSMGSFIARLYAEKYPHTVQGVIIHGTAGPNPLLGVGKLLAKLIKATKGERHRSTTLAALSIGAYAKKFEKTDGKYGWLTRDVSRVEGRAEDPRTSFAFTASAYHDLFTMLSRCNSREWFAGYPKAMPTLVISGDADPVGNFGKGPNYVYKQLLIAGCNRVELKMYKDARHELFNETNSDEVFCDLLAFCDGVLARL